MNEELKITDLREVLTYLDDKYILFTIADKKKTFCKIVNNDSIFFYNKEAHYTLSKNDFIDLFKDAVFYFMEDNIEKVDPGKDDEYYNILMKKK